MRVDEDQLRCLKGWTVVAVFATLVLLILAVSLPYLVLWTPADQVVYYGNTIQVHVGAFTACSDSQYSGCLHIGGLSSACRITELGDPPLDFGLPDCTHFNAARYSLLVATVLVGVALFIQVTGACSDCCAWPCSNPAVAIRLPFVLSLAVLVSAAVCACVALSFAASWAASNAAVVDEKGACFSLLVAGFVLAVVTSVAWTGVTWAELSKPAPPTAAVMVPSSPTA